MKKESKKRMKGEREIEHKKTKMKEDKNRYKRKEVKYPTIAPPKMTYRSSANCDLQEPLKWHRKHENRTNLSLKKRVEREREREREREEKMQKAIKI